jgi:predicted RNA-binding Zn ribbon-like protein
MKRNSAMMSRGSGRAASDWKDGFLFLGNQLTLDLLNTRPVQNGEAVDLLPDFSALVRWFVVAGLLKPGEGEHLLQGWGNSSRAQRAVDTVRELRERLRKEVLAWERGGNIRPATVSELNRLLLEHPMLSRMKVTEGITSVERFFETREPEDLLAPLAHSAATLFATVDHTRVRKCGQCVLHFQDTSKKGTRHWCSMRLCGNRVKVAAYSRRQRGDGE